MVQAPWPRGRAGWGCTLEPEWDFGGGRGGAFQDGEGGLDTSHLSVQSWEGGGRPPTFPSR